MFISKKSWFFVVQEFLDFFAKAERMNRVFFVIKSQSFNFITLLQYCRIDSQDFDLSQIFTTEIRLVVWVDLD